MNKMVSIIMPVYNGEQYITQCIESILNQTYENLEVMIADDGSTDKTREIVKQYQQKDKRIKLIEKPNTGVADSLNCCIKESKGNWLARMDADDLAAPNRFEKQVACLEETGADICYTYTDVFGEISESEKRYHENRYNFDGVTYEILLENDHLIAHPSVMFDRDFLFNIGLYDTSMYCEDWDLWFRALKEGATFKVVPEKLLRFRKHSSSLIASHTLFYVEKIKRRKLDAAKEYFQFKEGYPIWNDKKLVNYAIWGAGQAGRALYDCIQQSGWNWRQMFFIDSYKKGEFLSKRIISPVEIEEGSVDFIFITLKEGKKEAEEKLRAMGLVMFKDFMCI